MNFLYKINYKLILFILGFLAIINGAFMLISAGVSWYYEDGSLIYILWAGGSALISGAVLMLLTKSRKEGIQTREGFLIVTLGWLFMAFLGTLPYMLSGVTSSFSNAFFESMSGYTTTGSSIFNDVESLPKGILFWRSFTNWMGGMGMIVLTIAILPLLGIGGMQLFTAESPGPESNKFSPRISETAKRIWMIYVGYTLAEAVLLKFAGMSVFDAINHSMTSLATGGFSTKNASVAYWDNNPLIQYIITGFMFLGGTNFILSYFGFKFRFKKIFKDEEFKLYGTLILCFTAIATLIIYFRADLVKDSIAHIMPLGHFESSFRHAIFQVVSVITTTGFVTADFTSWAPFLTLLFLGLMLIGSSAGSTAGGPKVIRYLVMFKNGITEFKRMLHPNAIFPIRINKKPVSRSLVFSTLGFFILYMFAFMIGALVFSLLGYDLLTALGSTATTLGNVGPGMGSLGPIENFSSLPAFGKWWSAFLMLIGRLELFTVLVLFTAFYWKNR